MTHRTSPDLPAALPLCALLALGIACTQHTQTPGEGPSEAEAAEVILPAVAPIRTLPSAGVLYAMGDVHGDLDALRAALRLGGLIDEGLHWSGGEATLVQTGDLLDRGDHEEEILMLTARLEEEAQAAGGRAIFLNGNHEVMNVALDLRYVTPGGFKDFLDFPGVDPSDATLGQVPPAQRGRVAAFTPGGPAALMLAERGITLKVGDTVFVHGGVLPEVARYGLARLDTESQAWMTGQGPMPAPLKDGDGPIWSRHFADLPDAADCALLTQSLSLLGAKRMVVGHTVQEGGIGTFCDGAALAVDVGMSRYYGGRPGILRIEGDKIQILTAEAP